MKTKKLFILLFFAFIVLVLCGCGMGGGSYDNGSSYKESTPSGGDYNKTYNSEAGMAGYDPTISSGQLTSKAWSDNENYDYWLKLITPDENNQSEHYLATEYQNFINKTQLLYSKNMVKVVITKDGVPLEGARVEATFVNGNAEQVLFKGMTDSFGVCYLFFKEEHDANIKLAIYYNNELFNYTIEAIPGNRTVEVNLSDVELKEKIKSLDLCIVFDTTGSMGDELEYIKVELRNVIENVVEKTGFDVNLALIFYRDEGDQYVTRVFDFSSNLDAQYANLGAQSASGGGDWPESVEVALFEANKLQWRENSVKILIDVLDAPLHDTNARCTSFANQVLSFASKGVRVIPVIASGGRAGNKYNNLLEFTMRSAAIFTGGVYTYLTDDSGIGHSHSDPSTSDDIPVEYLNKMLTRLILQYCTGVRQDPEDYYQKEQQSDEQVIVQFDSAGGSKINNQLVEVGSTVSRPVDPTREGYQFVAWYYSKNGEAVAFDFSTPISEAITLTAVWFKIPE